MSGVYRLSGRQARASVAPPAPLLRRLVFFVRPRNLVAWLRRGRIRAICAEHRCSWKHGVWIRHGLQNWKHFSLERGAFTYVPSEKIVKEVLECAELPRKPGSFWDYRQFVEWWSLQVCVKLLRVLGGAEAA